MNVLYTRIRICDWLIYRNVSSMEMIKFKAFAYITYKNRLLVFRQPLAPEAGIQVPAGTIKRGETPEDAVMREAFEETGLADLSLAGFLGEHQRDMSDFGREEIQHRYFYHLICEGEPPERWQHIECDPSDALDEKPLFELFWITLIDNMPSLIADHDKMIPILLENLIQDGQVKG